MLSWAPGIFKGQPVAAGDPQGSQKWVVKAKAVFLVLPLGLPCPTQWFPVSFIHLVSFKSFLKRTAVHRIEDTGGKLKEDSSGEVFSLDFFSLAKSSR